MNDTHTEKSCEMPDASTGLSSPHFDELAVAIARPVQPLPPSRRKTLLRPFLLLIAYLAFIVAVIGIAYLRPPGSGEDTLSEETINETQPDVQPALGDGSATTTEDESVAATRIRGTKRHSKRASMRVRLPNQTIGIVEGAEGKPMPRKVGEIRYGRSSDRP